MYLRSVELIKLVLRTLLWEDMMILGLGEYFRLLLSEVAC